MYLKVEYFLILLLVISLRVTKQMDFCQSFVDNNNKIDSGYQHLFAGYYFFIDSIYWRLEYSGKTFKLLNRSATLRKINNKSFAFSVKVCENSSTECGKYHWKTGLYKDDTKTEKEWSHYMPDTRTPRFINLIELETNSASGDLIVKDGTHSLQTDLQIDIKPMIGFHLIVEPILCFLQQNSNKSENTLTYYRTYRCFRFNKEYLLAGAFIETIVMDNQTEKVIKNLKNVMEFNKVSYGSDQTILNDIEDKHQVIAIFDTGDRYVFFHTEDQRITYCFSSGKLFNKGCFGSELNILINCFNTTKGTTTTTLSTEEPIISGNETDYPINVTIDDIIPEFTDPIVNDQTSDGEVTEFPNITDEPKISNITNTSEQKSGSFSILWIFLVIVLFVIIIIVLFIVFKFILWEQKGHNQQLKDDIKSPKPTVSPVTGKPKVEKLAHKRRI